MPPANPRRAAEGALLRLALPALLAIALAGCAADEAGEPAPGEIAELTNRLDRDVAEERATATRDADARAKERADLAVERLDASSRARRRAD